MKHLNLFIELTRLNNPIGYMLLFWPCLWGLTLVYDFNGEIITYFKYLILFCIISAETFKLSFLFFELKKVKNLSLGPSK